MIAEHETLAAGKPHQPMLAMLETLDNCLQNLQRCNSSRNAPNLSVYS
jgi:hypothetical protein